MLGDGIAVAERTERCELHNRVMDQAASHWDEMATSPDSGLILRWWESSLLQGLVDAHWSQVTGCENVSEYIREMTRRPSLGTGISIGCGTAQVEISLLEEGVLERLIICDISSEQLNKAETFAAERGIDQDRLVRRDFIDLDHPLEEKVDLIFWRHALHHMLDTEQALIWSRDNLTDHGAIFCDDACPPNYMQWSAQVLDWVELFRASLPLRYLKSPYDEGIHLPNRPEIPSVEYWKSVDPTECVDSANIIPSIRKHAPAANVAYLGGCIYGLALEDVINNFRSEQDLPLLKNAMLLDEFMSNAGMNYYFTSVINKRDFI